MTNWGCRVKVFTVLTTNLPKVESSFLAIENYNKCWFWVQDVKFGHVFLAILLISNRDRSRYGFLQITCCSRVTYVDNKTLRWKLIFLFPYESKAIKTFFCIRLKAWSSPSEGRWYILQVFFTIWVNLEIINPALFSDQEISKWLGGDQIKKDTA